MHKNIGTKDRIIRVIMGIVCVALALFVAQVVWVKILLGMVALFCFFQAVFSWCLWYQIIGKNTCPAE